MIGTGLPRIVYAAVLAVAPLLPENVGTNGEPTLTLAFLDAPDPRALGKVDWHEEFERQSGVRHASHPDVKNRMVSLAWLDVLPEAGQAVTVDEFAGTDIFPLPEAAPLAATASEPSAPNNNRQMRGPQNKMAQVEGIPGEHPEDSAVHVDGKTILLKDVKRGMWLDDLKMTVTDTSYGNDGRLYVHTSKAEEKPDDATKVDDDSKSLPQLVGGIPAADKPEQMAGDGTQMKPGTTPQALPTFSVGDKVEYVGQDGGGEIEALEVHGGNTFYRLKDQVGLFLGSSIKPAGASDTPDPSKAEADRQQAVIQDDQHAPKEKGQTAAEAVGREDDGLDQPYTHTDGDFSQTGDPYGISANYTAQGFAATSDTTNIAQLSLAERKEVSDADSSQMIDGAPKGIAPSDATHHAPLGNDPEAEMVNGAETAGELDGSGETGENGGGANAKGSDEPPL